MAVTLGSMQGPGLSCRMWTPGGSGSPCLLSENREAAGQGLGRSTG